MKIAKKVIFSTIFLLMAYACSSSLSSLSKGLPVKVNAPKITSLSSLKSTADEFNLAKKRKEKSPASHEIRWVEYELEKLQKESSEEGWEPDSGFSYSLERIEANIKAIKKKDPYYSVKDYEKQLAELKAKFNEAMQHINRETKYREFLGRKQFYASLLFNMRWYKDIEFMRLVKKFNPDEVKAVMKEAKEFDPEQFGEKNNAVKYLNKFFKEFPKVASEKIKPIINELYEKAYKADKNDKIMAAVRNIKSATVFCDGIKILIPDSEDFKSLCNDVSKKYAELNKKMEALVYTSDFHKKNVGKIFFSDKKIEVKKEDPKGFKNSFKAGDVIYAIAYFDGIIGEMFPRAYYVFVSIDGGKYKSITVYVNKDEEKLSYKNFYVVPDPKTYEGEGIGYFMLDFLKDLSPRKHKIDILISPTYYKSEAIAGGSLEIDCSPGTEKFAEYKKIIYKRNLSKVRMPKPVKRSKKLENLFIHAFKKAGWKEKPLRAVVLSSNWQIVRSEWFKFILYRTMFGAVAVKLPNGECRVYELWIKQDYNGSSYENTQVDSVGNSYAIECKNIWK